MDIELRKIVSAIRDYAVEKFSDAEWVDFGYVTEASDLIENHPRLLRSLAFNDDDYSYCATQVVNEALEERPEKIQEVVEHFGVDLWLEEKDERRHQRVFTETRPLVPSPRFWREGYFRLFISHLADHKANVQRLKRELEKWGVSAFVAHTDIEPTREWQLEIEAALFSMDAMLPVLMPGFKESNWTDQEVGVAIGLRKLIIPARRGIDPYGFIGKYQGFQADGRTVGQVAEDVVKILLKSEKTRAQIVRGLSARIKVEVNDQVVTSRLKLIDELKIWSKEQVKEILESVLIRGGEMAEDVQVAFNDLQASHGVVIVPPKVTAFDDDDLPF